MKFLVTKKLDRKSPIYPPLVGLLLFFVFGILSNGLYIHSKISLFPQETVGNLLGDEENYIEPILFEELMGIIHLELLFYMFVIVLGFFIYFRLQQKKRVVVELILATLLAHTALFSLAFSATGSSFFVYTFLASFSFLNLFLLGVIVKIFLKVSKHG